MQTARRFPDFLGIGAQKAGTTWLYRLLNWHPALWMPPIKEIHYFSSLAEYTDNLQPKRRLARAKATLDNYLDKTPAEKRDPHTVAVLANLASGWASESWYGFLFGAAGEGQICGEITPDYATLPDHAIADALRLSPELKVILSLRDPIERCWSQLRMRTTREGVEKPQRFKRYAREDGLFERTDYPAIIAAWRKFVPAERFHIVFLDDIAARPRAVAEGLWDFLGVERLEPPERLAQTVVNVGPTREMPKPIRRLLKGRLLPVYEGMTALYPEIGAQWMARHY